MNTQIPAVDVDAAPETNVANALSEGMKQFMGLDLEINPNVLVPRLETELLAQTALQILRQIIAERGEANVLDLGTGSGNLALSLSHYETRCALCATDISPEAIELARRNAQRYQLDSRMKFFAGDLFAALPGDTFRRQFDLIVCNPPYISSGKLEQSDLLQHEPRVAFDGGPFGLSIISRLIQEAPGHLKPNSWLCFEVGAGQGKFVAACLGQNKNYVEIREVLSTGEVRVLAARTSETMDLLV